MMEYIDAYRHYKNGLFAVDGGLADQPIKYLDGIMVVDTEIGVIESEKVQRK